ncbi:hypothetical protein EDD99_3610 [Streptomyces sp. 846.5]|nr:hypothetical protein EDD99_3610 [Streptomyces sp. 846.5]
MKTPRIRLSTRWAANLPTETEALGEAFRGAVDSEILPLVQRMASRERLLAEFDDPASPVLRLGPVYRDVLFRLGHADSAEIESLPAQIADRPQRSRFAGWARSYLATAAT